MYQLMWNRLMVGKSQLCTLGERDVENQSLVNRIPNKSSSVFLALLDIFRTQSNLRQVNISRKRKSSKQITEISLEMDASQSAQASLGMYVLRTH